jgi:hypothetical protein
MPFLLISQVCHLEFSNRDIKNCHILRNNYTIKQRKSWPIKSSGRRGSPSVTCSHDKVIRNCRPFHISCGKCLEPFWTITNMIEKVTYLDSIENLNWDKMYNMYVSQTILKNHTNCAQVPATTVVWITGSNAIKEVRNSKTP